MSNAIYMLLLAAGLMVLLFAALHDIGFRTVPNRVSVTLLFLGAMLRIQQSDLPAGLVCGLVMFTVTYCAWRLGWIGGADAKLLSASAVFVPPSLVPTMIISIALSGGVLALIYLLTSCFVRHGIIRPAPKASLLTRVRLCELRRLGRRGPLPYAAAIAAGNWLTLTGP